MELALFWPNGGYYTSPERIGAEGDYFTAPGAHPAFGALIAVQFYQMWDLLGRPRRFDVVEMGAGGGLLCHDVMAYAGNLPDGFAESMRYLCLDRYAAAGAEAALPPEARQRVQRLATADVPVRGVTGCFLSNELVDAFPVHVIEARGGDLQEVYVTLGDGKPRPNVSPVGWGKLVETLGEPSTPLIQARLDALGVSLPEGYRTEVNLGIDPWMAQVAEALERGFVLTIDYGYPASEYYSPARKRGTLTCYYRHTQSNDALARPGRQDITAQVDFTSVARAGEAHRLATLGLVTQEQFLGNLGLGGFLSRLRGLGLRPRDAQANRMGMTELATAEGFGRFKVLAQAKGVESPKLWGIEGGMSRLDRDLPVPLLTPRHMPLMAGKYPDEEVEVGWPWGEEHGPRNKEQGPSSPGP